MPDINCTVCGKSFHIPNCYINRVSCCSKECKYKNATKQVDRTCEVCGKTFTTNSSRTKRFCSMECAFIGRKPKQPRAKDPTKYVTCYCEWCNKEFTILKWLVDHSNGGRFCSKKCLGEWHSQELRGEKHFAWKGGIRSTERGTNWQTQKKQALERDNYTCQICHKKQGKRKYFMHVHHIKKFSLFHGDYIQANDLSNLITLCFRCHKAVERGAIACPIKML